MYVHAIDMRLASYRLAIIFSSEDEYCQTDNEANNVLTAAD